LNFWTSRYPEQSPNWPSVRVRRFQYLSLIKQSRHPISSQLNRSCFSLTIKCTKFGTSPLNKDRTPPPGLKWIAIEVIRQWYSIHFHVLSLLQKLPTDSEHQLLSQIQAKALPQHIQMACTVDCPNILVHSFIQRAKEFWKHIGSEPLMNSRAISMSPGSGRSQARSTHSW
jgi:hypothetical protein